MKGEILSIETALKLAQAKKIIIDNKKRMIDILEIKNSEYLKFYLENNFIYCENIITEEKVIIGEVKE